MHLIFIFFCVNFLFARYRFFQTDPLSIIDFAFFSFLFLFSFFAFEKVHLKHESRNSIKKSIMPFLVFELGFVVLIYIYFTFFRECKPTLLECGQVSLSARHEELSLLWILGLAIRVSSFALHNFWFLHNDGFRNSFLRKTLTLTHLPVLIIYITQPTNIYTKLKVFTFAFVFNFILELNRSDFFVIAVRLIRNRLRRRPQIDSLSEKVDSV